MMTDKVLGNNQVNVYGEVISEFAFSHEVYGEGFYILQLHLFRYHFCPIYHKETGFPSQNDPAPYWGIPHFYG